MFASKDSMLWIGEGNLDNRCEVIIQDYNVWAFFSNFCPRDTHWKTNIGLYNEKNID
jgi:hypothetical protein